MLQAQPGAKIASSLGLDFPCNGKWPIGILIGSERKHLWNMLPIVNDFGRQRTESGVLCAGNL